MPEKWAKLREALKSVPVTRGEMPIGPGRGLKAATDTLRQAARDRVGFEAAMKRLAETAEKGYKSTKSAFEAEFGMGRVLKGGGR